MLDSKMAELQHQGVGTVKKQSDPVSVEDEEQLWASGAISLITARGLSHAVYYYNNICFGLRANDEHRSLEPSQYKFKEETNNGKVVEKLVFQGRLSKACQGGLKQQKVKPKKVEVFARPDDPKCPVTLFRKYLSCIPADGPFYKQPHPSKGRKEIAFTKSNVGENTLGGYMKRMFAEANIDITGRNITGHSGKVTLCTRLFNAGFSEQVVKSKSGHRSNAVEAYKRPLFKMRFDASEACHPPQTKKNK